MVQKGKSLKETKMISLENFEFSIVSIILKEKFSTEIYNTPSQIWKSFSRENCLNSTLDTVHLSINTIRHFKLSYNQNIEHLNYVEIFIRKNRNNIFLNKYYKKF